MDDLYRRVAEIIKAEENSKNVNWQYIQGRCLSEIKYIIDKQITGIVDPIIYEYLDDCDIRRHDSSYAMSQRDKVRKILEGQGDDLFR